MITRVHDDSVNTQANYWDRGRPARNERRRREEVVMPNHIHTLRQSRTGQFWREVISTGAFETRTSFQPTDLLFAAAGEVHRFENFSDDLTVWVLFYGPEGGEART